MTKHKRVAVVTGGTRGIGAAISSALHAEGYKVAATYAGNDKAAAAFSEQTGVATYKFDVSKFDACKENLAKIEKDLGPVEVLINNAGITRDGFLHKMTQAQWHEVMETNLDSVFNMSRLVIEGMRERGFGRIISISSINGQAGQAGQTNYSAAKAGIIGFTKALALEGASKGITVNAIAPGYIETDMVRAISPEVLEKIVAKIPVKRLGKVEEIAHMVVFLASDASSFTSGATFNLNGAQYLM
ncbi:MAG: acetoacetyl-CoA reductase [Alphaproteobacteria bacterium]|nr:acetoacetyl-CoA reductase [Alphaproteobacteria bacterium]